MSKTKHAPGPWRVDTFHGGVTTADGKWQICGEGDWGGRIHEADARLIAAAPELLDALKRVIDSPFEPDKWRINVEAAIAKAEEAK